MMGLTVKATGTQACTVGTEHTLVNADPTAGVWVFTADLSNLVDGDEVELRVYTKGLTGDSAPKLAFYANYIHKQGDAAAPGSSGQGEVIKDSPPVVSPYVVSFTVKQVAGTGRNIPWRACTL